LFNWPHIGALISALAVFFDAGLRECGKITTRNTLMVCAAAGIAASQIARVIAHGFRQAELRAFANSGASPILGCLCGLTAGIFVVYFAKRRIARAVICCAPVAALAISALVLIVSGEFYRGH